MILRIARNELANLFYTPVVWLLFILFIVVTGVQTCSTLDHLVMNFEKGRIESWHLFEQIFQFNFGGIYSSTIKLLMFLVPLLSMRVMTREHASGSIKLLYSSPIKSSTIIVGKYLALVVLTLMFCAILMLLSFIVCHYIDTVNYTLLMYNLLAIFVLWCTYLAIGVFISCLTRYQIVAAIGTMALLAALHYCGSLWQWKDGVRNVTDWLCISNRATSMMYGLINSADIIYFFLITTLFLSLAIYTIEYNRVNKKKRLQLNMKLGSVLLLTVVVGYLSTKPQNIAYLDVTEHKSMTLSQESQNILSHFVDEPINITTYVNVLGPNLWDGSPSQRLRDLSRYSDYSRYIPKWNMEYVYYYHDCTNPKLFRQNKDLSLKELAEKVCLLEHINIDDVLSPEEIDNRIDLSKEEYKFVREVKYKDRSILLRLFNDRQKHPGEAEITAALNSFLNPPMTVGVLQGHKERDMNDIKNDGIKDILVGRLTRQALINNGFIPQEIKLNAPIQDDLVFLLIADPLLPYSAEELSHLQDYIDKGGNLIINGSTQSRTSLAPILSRFDLALGEHPLTELDRWGNYTQSISHTDSLVNKLHASIDLGKYTTSLPYATAIHLPQSIVNITDSCEVLTQSYTHTTKKGETFEYIPVLATTDSAWLEHDATSIVVRNSDLSCDTAIGEVKKSYQTAVALVRQVKDREQKIIVVSSADYITSEGILATKSRRMNNQGNGRFFKGLTCWMSNGELPIYIKEHYGSDRYFTMGLREFKIFKTIWFGIMPGMLLLFAALLLWRRKRR